MKPSGATRLLFVALATFGAFGCGDTVCVYTLEYEQQDQAPAGKLEVCAVMRKSDCKGTAHPMADGDDRKGSSPLAPGRTTCNKLGFTETSGPDWKRPRR